MTEFKDIWDNYLKEKAKIAIIGALISLVVVIVIIILSKINEYQKYKVPVVMRTRIKSVIQEALKKFNEAKKHIKESDNHQSNIRIAYHNIIESHAMVESAKRLVGGPR